MEYLWITQFLYLTGTWSCEDAFIETQVVIAASFTAKNRGLGNDESCPPRLFWSRSIGYGVTIPIKMAKLAWFLPIEDPRESEFLVSLRL